MINLLNINTILDLNNLTLNIDPRKRNKFNACFSGMKTSKVSKLYTFLWFLKRFIMCGLVFFLQDLNVTTKTIMFISIQVLYFLSVVILRCPKKITDQLIDIFTEFTFIVLISWLLFNSKMEDWSKTDKYLFVTIILSIFIIQALINLGKFR